MAKIKWTQPDLCDNIFTVSDIVSINKKTVYARSNGIAIRVTERTRFTVREVNHAWVKSKV